VTESESRKLLLDHPSLRPQVSFVEVGEIDLPEPAVVLLMQESLNRHDLPPPARTGE
jgi:hypothetical protein